MFSLGPETARFYAQAAQLAAARIGLARALPGDAETLAERTGTRAPRLRALLDALCLDGTLVRDGSLFRLAAPMSAEPLPPSGWGQLAEVLLADRPLPPPADERPFHEHLLRANAAVAAALWRTVPAEGPLLDLGGGYGAFTQAFLDAHPEASATLFDRPEIAHKARVPQVVAGDLFRDPLGVGFGTVLLANVLHLYPADACRVLMARAVRALRPGGRAILVDLFVEPDRSGPAAAIYFALNMALYSDGGTVHDAGDLTAWLDATTLSPAVIHRLGGDPEVIAVTAEPI